MRRRTPPLAHALAGIEKPLREIAEIVRHKFPRPEAFEDLDCCFGELAKMPIDDHYMGDPG
jgi:hypothetical protein